MECADGLIGDDGFLAFIGVFFAPLCAIQIVDFLILRKQRLDVRSLYDSSPEAPYYYWGGFNPAGLAGMAAGFVTYVYLLNPLTYVSRSPRDRLPLFPAYLHRGAPQGAGRG